MDWLHIIIIMMAGCETHTRLRTARHHSTFTLLVESLRHSDGGRWPLLAMDLGNGHVKDFEAEFQKAFTGPDGEEQQDPTTADAGRPRQTSTRPETLDSEERKSPHIDYRSEDPTIHPPNCSPSATL